MWSSVGTYLTLASRVEGKRFAGYVGVTSEDWDFITGSMEGFMMASGYGGYVCCFNFLVWHGRSYGFWLKDCMVRCGLVMLVVKNNKATSVLLFCRDCLFGFLRKVG